MVWGLEDHNISRRQGFCTPRPERLPEGEAQGQSQGPRGAKFLHEGNLKVEEVCVGFFVGVVCLMGVDGGKGMGMVCVVDDLGFWLFWVHLGIMVLCVVGIRGSRYFPKAGILHPEA